MSRLTRLQNAVRSLPRFAWWVLKPERLEQAPPPRGPSVWLRARALVRWLVVPEELPEPDPSASTKHDGQPARLSYLRELLRWEELPAAPPAPSPTTPSTGFVGWLFGRDELPRDTSPTRSRGPGWLAWLFARESLELRAAPTTAKEKRDGKG